MQLAQIKALKKNEGNNVLKNQKLAYTIPQGWGDGLRNNHEDWDADPQHPRNVTCRWWSPADGG